MAITARTTTLSGHFAARMMAEALERSPNGRPSLRLVSYLRCCQRLYETGAAIGHAFRDRPQDAARLIAQAGEESEVMSCLWKLAEQRLAACGNPPDSFFDLIWFAEARNMGLSAEGLFHLADRRLPVDGFLAERAELAFSEGIGFGTRFPDLTERLWPASSTADAVSSSDQPGPSEAAVLLERSQDAALQEVRAFLAQQDPALPDLMPRR